MFRTGALGDEMLHRLDKMSQLDVGLDVLATLLDRLLGHLPFLVGGGEALLYRVTHGCGHLLRQRADIASGQSAISGHEGRIGASGRLQPGEPFAFTCSVNSDQRFEKVTVSNTPCVFALTSNRQCRLKYGLDLLCILLRHPLQNWKDILRGKSSLSIIDDGTVHAIAVSLRVGGIQRYSNKRQGDTGKRFSHLTSPPVLSCHIFIEFSLELLGLRRFDDTAGNRAASIAGRVRAIVVRVLMDHQDGAVGIEQRIVAWAERGVGGQDLEMLRLADGM
jgi:hypothetical protein